MRLITMLGFPPAIWFGGDSVSYVNSGLHQWPGVSRESGYGIFLEIFHPFHSFFVVTAVQHLLGLAMGVLVYALLRHRYRLPAWGATLAALPVLLDVYVIQLEQEILADSTFAFLCLAAVTLVLWWPDDRRPWWSTPAAALLLGVASAFWPVGLPLLIVLLVYMAVRRFGWRALVATVVGGAIPLVAYLGWFDARYGQVAFNDSDGVFLWSRTMSFAECSVIKPPADLLPLCPSGPPSSRVSAPFYIWEANSPLLRVGTGSDKFSRTRNHLAEKFAIKAIEAQPLSYANVVVRGWLLTYSWDRPDVPSPAMASRYQFTNATQTQNALSGLTAQDVASGIAALHRVQRAYTGGHTADTREVQPFADIMIDYQKIFYLRGTIIGLLMLVGLGGIVVAWRRDGFRTLRNWGGPALFPFVAALTMEVVPPLTADFSLRYVVPTIPVVSLAAALAFARPLRATALAAAGDAAGRAGDDADQGPPADGERAVVTAAQQRPAETTDQGGNTTS
ncbi:MAG TPA: hypothetical protein VMR00_17860 [Streptosporangiaceae bacterium]|jgi:hypothetical protein|nr:hypothetical protein [Streptosporangiaceae bacterium]